MGFLKQVLRLPRETRAAGTVTTDVLYGIFSSENSYSRTVNQNRFSTFHVIVHKLSDILDTICSYIIVVMLGAMVVITGAQIVCRMAFTALSWSEEATRYLLVWSSFLGASCVYKHSGHISITFVQDMVPAALSKVLKLLVHVVCTVLFVVVIIYGMKYFGKQGNQLSAAMRLPMKYIYLCIPVGCGFMLVHAVDAVLGLLFGKEEA